MKKNFLIDFKGQMLEKYSLLEKIDWLLYAYARANDYRWFVDNVI